MRLQCNTYFFSMKYTPQGYVWTGGVKMAKQLEQQQASLQITGMTCAACANRIEKGLKKLEGVAEANVNFALEKASVTYNPNQISVSAMEEKILDLGYSTVKDAVDFNIVGMTCGVLHTY